MIELLENILTMLVHKNHKDETRRNELEHGIVEPLMGLSLLERQVIWKLY